VGGHSPRDDVVAGQLAQQPRPANQQHWSVYMRSHKHTRPTRRNASRAHHRLVFFLRLHMHTVTSAAVRYNRTSPLSYCFLMSYSVHL
jgi:hypothetical protein